MAESHDVTTCTKRLLPHIIDERAKAGYTRPFALYPKSTDTSAGFHSISYARIAGAVNRVSWWLDSELTGQEEKENPFAYFGPNDLRYIIFLMATMKTGRKLLFASPRNTIRAQRSLFEKINCKAIVLCSSLNQSLQPLIAASGLRHIQAPKLDDLLAEYLAPHYAYDTTWGNLSNDKFLTIHTSGSSGDPKPIRVGKYYVGAFDSANCLPDDQGLASAKTSFRYQNAGGLAIHMLAAYLEMTIVLGHPDIPVSSAHVAELLKTERITAMVSPPSILEDLSKDPSSLHALSKLKHIAYGGGPLKPAVGNVLAQSVLHIFSFIGATETIQWFHCLNGSNEVWDSIRYFDNIGYRFEEVSKGIFEHIVVNDEKTNIYHGVFEIFPDLKEYRTKDLYSRHPTAPGWLRYKGRADDLIVLSNGEKINPIPVENMICSHPVVKAALVIGEYRFNASLLVELEDAKEPRSEEQRHERLDEIWSVVEEVNKITPGFAKIPKSLVVFAASEKPFLRAGKGTVQRQLTVRAYAEELDRLYASQEGSLLTEYLTLTEVAEPNDIKIFVREIYKQALEDENLSDSEDVFQKGMDSLGVSVVVRRLKAALEACSISLKVEDINPRIVYSAATVDKLTDAILTLIDNAQGLPHTNRVTPSEESMKSMLEKYSKNMLRTGPMKTMHSTTDPWTVLVTGTTGSLGTYILAALDQMPKSKIGRIFCLNRSADAKERQRTSNLSREIDASWYDSESPKVEFLQVDFVKADFGLGPNVYANLMREATVIIHSAWKVDFSLSIESFEPQIHGVRNLLDFSSKSTKKAPLMFISSISAIFGWMDSNPLAKVPETIISDFDAPEKIGYGESKFVCEQLFDQFTTSSEITTAILRTGQIAGPISQNGMWNKQEWLPSIIASSKYLGILPETLGGMDTVDWVPVDLLSTIILELAEKVVHHDESEKEQGTFVYNLVNPQTTTWSSLLPAVQESIGVQKVVSFNGWVQALQQSSTANNGALMASNPGVKLLDFYHDLSEKQTAVEGSRYAVDNLMRDSKEASDLTTVSPDWMRLWLRQWSF
ncbi:acetyl-CoA synthetase-like protein [Cadophora sp. DSE1049]|nr:acetyl-CoA synthetase-like protein [Cadophora sp. DSE1049]